MVQCVHQPGGKFVSPLFAILWEHLRAYIATLRRDKITRKLILVVAQKTSHTLQIMNDLSGKMYQ